MSSRICVIADIVGSRALQDRAGAQRAIEREAIRVERDHPVAHRRLTATVGDEFQAEYLSLFDAVTSILLMQFALPDGVQLRFGVGVGTADGIASETEGISDGPGWWAAREAVDSAHQLQDRGVPRARTVIFGAAEEDGDMTAQIRLANAYVRARDDIVGAMSERARRLAYGRFLGRTQRELAEAEGITQSAVSQLLSSSGATALLAGLGALDGKSR